VWKVFESGDDSIVADSSSGLTNQLISGERENLFIWAGADVVRIRKGI